MLEQVNAVMGNLFASDVMSKELKTDNVSQLSHSIEIVNNFSVFFSKITLPHLKIQMIQIYIFHLNVGT